MEEIQGKSRNSIVYFYESYTYHIDKRIQDTYRCSNRRSHGCRGLALVNEDGTVTIASVHDHPPNNMAARISKLRQEMYRLCEESVQPFKKIFDDVCERLVYK